MLTQRVSITNQDARQVSATQLHVLGTICETADGRAFRYASSGATALAAGLVNVTPAKVANHTNVAVALAAGVGAKSVTVTLGATAATADQYRDGYLTVNDGAGVGANYRITGNAAISSAGTGVIQLSEGIATALTTASKVTLTPNPWANTIVHPGGASAFYAAGVPTVAVAANSFYWAHTSGIGSVLSDGVIAKGASGILTANAVPGAVTTEGGATVSQRVGVAPEATVDTKYYPLFLTLE